MIRVAGSCSICNKRMLIEQVIDGRIQKRYLPDYTGKVFTLDDGSSMRIPLCKSCLNNISPDDYDNLVDSILGEQ